MLVTELGMVTEVRREQPQKRLSLIAVTLVPITASYKSLPKRAPKRLRPRYNFLIDVGRLLLFGNTMVISPSSNVKFSTLEQPSNALLPMLVTELGMVMEVRLEQFRNAESPIHVTELGIFMEFRSEHSINAHVPILVTEAEKETEVRFEQPTKSLSLISVNRDPIVTFTKFFPKRDIDSVRSRPRYNSLIEFGRLLLFDITKALSPSSNVKVSTLEQSLKAL